MKHPTTHIFALLAFLFSSHAAAEVDCRSVQFLLTEDEPPLTCAYDLCGTSRSVGTFGEGSWEVGFNFTDLAPPPAPIPEGLVLVGSTVINFHHRNGDILFGHSVFVAAPNIENVSGAVYLFSGGTGRFAEASGSMVDIKLQEESRFRLKGELCGVQWTRNGKSLDLLAD